MDGLREQKAGPTETRNRAIRKSLHNLWPAAALFVGGAVTVAWIALLCYGLSRLLVYDG
jgi:hypothetical protein